MASGHGSVTETAEQCRKCVIFLAQSCSTGSWRFVEVSGEKRLSDQVEHRVPALPGGLLGRAMQAVIRGFRELGNTALDLALTPSGA